MVKVLNWIRRFCSAFVRVSHLVVRPLAVLSLIWFATAAQSSVQTPLPFPPDTSTGRLIVLPGIHNTLIHLDGFMEMARASLPGFDIERRKWGITFLGIRNLRATDHNVSFARNLAAEIAQWRRENPDELLYLMGYSGGGGVASLVLAELPSDVRIDRAILIAPAISVDFPIVEHAAEHVTEFVINFASRKDIQVGLGTRLFGTIDRKYEYAAGFGGFDTESDRLLQWRWTEADQQIGHYGNHVAYLGRRWQRDFLLPVLNPSMSRAALDRLWRERRAAFDTQ